MKVRIFGLVLMLALLATGVVAYATAANPYGGYGTYMDTYYSNRVVGYTNKCSCKPVSNILSVQTRAQYLSGTSYKWTAWDSKNGLNTSTQFVNVDVVSPGVRHYGESKHRARCGLGNVVSKTSHT